VWSIGNESRRTAKNPRIPMLPPNWRHSCLRWNWIIDTAPAGISDPWLSIQVPWTPTFGEAFHNGWDSFLACSIWTRAKVVPPPWPQRCATSILLSSICSPTGCPPPFPCMKWWLLSLDTDLPNLDCLTMVVVRAHSAYGGPAKRWRVVSFPKARI